MDKFFGKWEVTDFDEVNYTNMVTKLGGLPEEKIRAMIAGKFTVEYGQDGDMYTYCISLGTGETMRYKFKLGEEVETVGINGKKLKTKVTFKDGKIYEHHVQMDDGTKIGDIEKEIVDGEGIVTCRMGDEKCVLRHKKIA